MLIRDFRFDACDYRATRSLLEKVYPREPTSVEVLRFEDAARPKIWWRKRVAEIDGRFAALGMVSEAIGSHWKGDIRLRIHVDPDCLNQGIGTQLYADLLALAHEQEPVGRLATHTREDQTQASEFLSSTLYKVELREKGFEVGLTTIS